MSRTFLYSHNFASVGARNLCAALGIKRIRHNNSTYRHKEGDVVINWGCSNLPDEVAKARIINDPGLVDMCSNKLAFFDFIGDKEGVHVPPYTRDKEQVREWLGKGNVVFCRSKLRASGGEGIVELEGPEEDIPDAPLYTLYIPKKQEYRVHVIRGDVVVVQRKAKRADMPNDQVNWRVRNHDNGFIFARNESKNPPKQVSEMAREVSRIVGLDFLAVDIIYNEYRDKSYVLEINTAPGLEGQTVDDYVEAFKNILGVEI